jgi:hypothetical protein
MAAAVNASRSGDLLNDIYELCEIVESRDTHQLYSARDTRNDRLVHIALLRPEVALRNGVAQRFIKGPKALTLIEHPNVARIWSVESDATGIPFIVEEPKSGQTLASMIESFPDGMPLGVAVNLLVPVVEAMAAAHGSGLTHGAFDAKHVLLSEQSGNTVPKVFGFGESDTLGSPCDDVRAIGALMYRALSGQAADAKRRIPLDEIAPHLPLELTELVERCLADQDERPADARMLSDELNGLRQKIGGQRASTVNAERFAPKTGAVAKPAAAPKPATKVAEKPVEKPTVEKERRRVVMERAETAPMEPTPANEPVAAKIDPHGATFVDAVAPVHEPQPTPKPAPVVEHARDRDSVEFPMASMRPGQPQPAAAAKAKPVTPDQIATKVDEPLPELKAPEPRAKAQAPEQTREDRGGKGKARKQDSAKASKDEPGINVAGPARLAAAFAPLEGAANIEQGETREAGLGREFRRQQDEEREKREARYGRPMPMSAATAPANQKQAGPETKNGAALFNAKSDGKKQPARPSAAEVIALGQLHAQEEEKKERRSRLIGALFLFLFCFLLARAVPLLTGPRERALEVLGPNLKITAVAFAAFSVVMLIKTWALQIQSKEMLLKPVTYTMKVVVICAVVLCASQLMAPGALGIVEGAARRFLPWGGAAYFMFLGFYGMMKGMRETQANMIAGIAMTLAYGGSFVGSYSIAHDVIGPNMRASRAQAEIAMQMVEAQKRGEKLDPKLLLGNAGVDPDMAAEIAKQAAAEDGFEEAKMAGGNEEEDMKAIREMGNARKRNGERLDELKDKLPELTK